MAGTPLKIDWSQMLPEKGASTPPLELEVEPTSVSSSISVLESSSWPIEQKLTDGQIEEKITRLTMHLGSDIVKNLSDKGKKLQANLQAWQKELERRKLTRIQTIDDKCEAATESKAAEPSVAPRNSLNAIATSECDPPSSFFSLFKQKLDERAGSASTSKISSANPCQINEGTNLCHMSSQATLPLTCMESSKEKKSHFNAICSSIQTSSFYAPCAGRRFSKRLKLSEGRDALIWRAKKDPATRQLRDVVLLDEEEVQPKDPIRYASDERNGAKMYYPSRDHPEAVELFYSDMKCLEPEQYISSPILDFYIRYLQRSLSYVYKNKGEYYFFNTYFFGKLEQALSSKGDRSLQFSKLRRWWKGINIFEKAYIFLPIHKDFLTEEWKYVKQNASSPHISSGEKILIDVPLKVDKKEIKVPQQKNEYDCGLFVLYFMERFINDEAHQRFNRNDPNMFGTEWFQPEEASSLRKRIQDLLLEEFESSRLDCGTEEGHDQSPSSSSEPDEELRVKSSKSVKQYEK
ncbi:ubiquitin-like-specific protease 1D isoform X2 [Dendrobium catenatum]|uniref:ubiquitin-like-specific protease 1D isoform X2 n=1 Tax=Dendrobium catenatum TaxID=906689 RepID=UPI0009F63589|nr:ubiquitin-like-specific protease 1D isoform X2 [Dendrobium catenatum]